MFPNYVAISMKERTKKTELFSLIEIIVVQIITRKHFEKKEGKNNKNTSSKMYNHEYCRSTH